VETILVIGGDFENVEDLVRGRRDVSFTRASSIYRYLL
jgi:hypothetical protein